MRSRLCGPYKVIQRVGEVAYELELLEGSRIRTILYVSCLEKALGRRVTASIELSTLDERGRMIPTPEEVLDVWERSLRRRVIMEYRIRWKD